MSATPLNGSRKIPPAPYKGLVPYTEEDAALFFGRDAERSIIVANLRSSRFTLLYGPSGVGKSSVVGAGVVYYLRQKAKQTLQKRGWPEFAVVYFNQWRDDPVAGLLGAVQQAVETLLDKSFAAEPPPAPNATLDDQLKTWADRAGGDLLIILDQFEDYFLYHPNEDGPGTFVYEFPRVVTDNSARINFIIAIREDAVAKLDRFEGRIPTLFDNYIRVDHLDRDAARDAIVKPIEQYNKSIGDPGLRVNIEPELVEAVLDQVKTGQVSMTDSGAGVLRGGSGDNEEGDKTERVETPFLQLVMTRLWDEELRSGSHTLHLETLNRLGGAERIVRTHLDKTMGSLPESERKAAAGMFHYLVTPSGAKIAHTARDLAEYTGTSEKQLTPVLEKMSASGIRILRPVAPPPDHLDAPTRYEIFHDVLAPAMLDWRRRYLQQRRNRLIYFGVGAAAVLLLLLIGGLLLNLRNSQAQLQQKAQEAQNLSAAILASAPTNEPNSSATVPPTLVAIRETAQAVGTSASIVTCQGAPDINFTASNNNIAPGSPVYLQWTAPVRVSGVTIAPDIGKVDLEGSQAVQLVKTTTYTLSAVGCGGTATRTVTVNVVAPTVAPNPPTAAPATATAVPPTATKAPATATRPAATVGPTVAPTVTTVNAPPGVYITNMAISPDQPRAGQPVNFAVSVLNTTPDKQRLNFCVFIFKPDDFPKKSTGQTTCTPTDIPVGATEIPAQPWTVGPSGGCVPFLALASYKDGSGARIDLNKPDGSQNWTNFTLC